MRIARLVTAAVGVAVLATLSALPASAASGDGYQGRHISRWEQTYTLHEDGTVDVVVEFDFDFGNEPGHGPYLTLPTLMGYDDEYDRIYTVDRITASSPSGAPADLDVRRDDFSVFIRIGDPNIDTVSGVQTYEVRYRLHDLMNNVNGRDEFYWNVINADRGVPISHATVTVESPVEVLQVACYAGRPGSDSRCESAQSRGNTAVFTHDMLTPWDVLTVAVAYPGGSFHSEPNLQYSNFVKRAFAVTPQTVGLALGIFVAGLGIVLLFARTVGRDRQYRDLIPGLTPHDGTSKPRTQLARRTEVTVQFTPPPGLSPGVLGTLIDDKADPRDVAATLVDLAVRGYIRIEEASRNPKKAVADKPDDYRFYKLESAGGELAPFEANLLESLFYSRSEVTLHQLKRQFAGKMAAVQRLLYDDVVGRGWYRNDPRSSRNRWSTSGIVVFIIGFLLTACVAQVSSFALIALPVPILGVIIMMTAPAAPARTAAGSAVLEQARGFKHYLETAEARQLVHEEGDDVFSRYMPFAIAFGIADKWAEKFAELAKEGVSLGEPSWYSGVAHTNFWASAGSLGDRMNGFTRLTTSSMSAPTPGSSGGSGFGSGGGGGGGGRAGGGGGGGSVGGW